jgi:hypothetical protein
MTAARAVVLMLLAGGVAEAQSTPQGPASDRRLELSAGVMLTGPVGLGTSTASLVAPDGSAFTLFHTESRLAAGAGVEVHLGYRLTSKLTAEASGSWNRVGFRTAVSGDAEGIPDATLQLSASRFSVEGSATWILARRNKMDFFARGGGGWMRELAEGNSLYEDAGIGSVGGGMKYWLKERTSGRIRRLGLRFEGRALVRSKGLTLGGRSTKVVPVFCGSLILGL